MQSPDPEDEITLPGYQDLLVSLIVGILAFSSIGFVIFRLGVGLLPAVGFSLLSGVAVAAFILRERSLMNRISEMDRRHVSEVGALSDRLEHLYESSSAALVQYDAGTLMVERAGMGFLDLLKVRAEDSIRGRGLEEVLGVDATTLERLTDDIRAEGLREPCELECVTATGDAVRLLVSGIYLKDRHVMEAAFLPTAVKKADAYDVDRALGDLERFRHGMARREQRILELKGEVNELLKNAGSPTRYRVDYRTKDTKNPLSSLNGSVKGGGTDV
ncbi:MAG: hypothetical protein ACOCVJ_02960 [Verrucomicrobiota bacterium]